MSMSVKGTYSALRPGNTSSLQGYGGTEPYSYAVNANGAGGTIDSNGIYTAPAFLNPAYLQNPMYLVDTITVTDSDPVLPLTATFQIFVGTPLLLVGDIIRKEMGLSLDRVYMWDQKLFQPKDGGAFVVVSEVSCKPFASNKSLDAEGNSVQTLNMQSTLQIDIKSRNAEARDRKEEIILALGSFYAQSQGEKNGFYIGRLPAGSRFLNISIEDGAAIPYQYSISMNIQYAVVKNSAALYYDHFPAIDVITNS